MNEDHPENPPEDTPAAKDGATTPAAPAGGERIAKAIARAGLASRRAAERLVLEGRVAVNGQVIASPALDVGPGDRVVVDGQPLDAPQPARMWLYYKPAGLVTTESDELGRRTIYDELPDDLPRVITVGRLDLNSEGLLLLTNDGELKRRLEMPATGWLRRYRVRVNGRPSNATFDPLRRGVVIEGEEFQPMEVSLDSSRGDNAWLTVGIREGRNREIRRAMAHVGLTVNRLIRLSYGPFRLGAMKLGEVAEVRRRLLRDQLGPLLPGNEDAEADPRGQRGQRGRDAGRPGGRDAARGGADARRGGPQQRAGRPDRAHADAAGAGAGGAFRKARHKPGSRPPAAGPRGHDGAGRAERGAAPASDRPARRAGSAGGDAGNGKGFSARRGDGPPRHHAGRPASGPRPSGPRPHKGAAGAAGGDDAAGRGGVAGKAGRPGSAPRSTGKAGAGFGKGDTGPGRRPSGHAGPKGRHGGKPGESFSQGRDRPERGGKPGGTWSGKSAGGRSGDSRSGGAGKPGGGRPRPAGPRGKGPARPGRSDT